MLQEINDHVAAIDPIVTQLGVLLTFILGAAGLWLGIRAELRAHRANNPVIEFHADYFEGGDAHGRIIVRNVSAAGLTLEGVEILRPAGMLITNDMDKGGKLLDPAASRFDTRQKILPAGTYVDSRIGFLSGAKDEIYVRFRLRRPAGWTGHWVKYAVNLRLSSEGDRLMICKRRAHLKFPVPAAQPELKVGTAEPPAASSA